MKTFEFIYRERKYKLNLQHVTHVISSTTTSWVYMTSSTTPYLEFPVHIGESIAEALEG